MKGKNINLGSYYTDEEAAKVVDEYKINRLGIEYGLNFKKGVEFEE